MMPLLNDTELNKMIQQNVNLPVVRLTDDAYLEDYETILEDLKQWITEQDPKMYGGPSGFDDFLNDVETLLRDSYKDPNEVVSA